MKRILLLISVGLMLATTGKAKPTHTHPPEQVPLTRPSVPAGDMTVADLLAFARFHQRYKPKDSFVELPSEGDLDGKEFTYTVSLRNTSAIEPAVPVHASWEYHSNSKILKFSVVASMWSTASFVNTLSIADMASSSNGFGFYLTRAIKKKSSYVGSNAFGVSAYIDVYENSGIGLMQFGGSDANWLNDMFLNRSITMDSETARREMADARIVISGRLRAYAPDKVILCGQELTTPTLDNPIHVTDSICMFSAVFNNVKIVSTTNQVLAQWDGEHRSDQSF
jgi:hypothetical protein